MAKYTRNERIAILVIEDQIYDYYNSIIDRLMQAQNGAWFTDIDSDDIKSVKARANEVFKSIANADIYDALSEVFDYDKNTIISKISKHRKRVDIWNKFKIDPDDYFVGDKTTLLCKELTEMCYILQYIENGTSYKNYRMILKGIAEHRIDNKVLSEDDIYEIQKIISDRSDAIYDGNPDSKVTPAIILFERKMMEYEKPADIPVEPEEPVFSQDPTVDDKSPKKYWADKAMSLAEYVDIFNIMGINHATICMEYEGKKWWIAFNKDRD